MRQHLAMKELPETERPYEKLEKYGEKALSNAELLAIIIKTGSKNENCISLAQKIIKNCQDNLLDVFDYSLNELMKIKGIGRVKAIQIKAVFELGKRFVLFKKNNNICIKSPQDIADYLLEDMRLLKKEYVKEILLNTKNYVIKTADITVGSLNSSIVHPREVFSEAIKCSAASIILVHNHPSGDPSPSTEDISITKRIQEAGKILGIELLDHVIIGDKNFVSLKEQNIF